MNILLTKETDWCKKAEEIVLSKLPGFKVLKGESYSSIPEELREWEGGDYLISFLSPWILSHDMLSRAKKYAINFHPGPPEYPGIGCYNFAIYNRERKYGVTCHHMDQIVDSGGIISVEEFAMPHNITVAKLKEVSMSHLLAQLERAMDILAKDGTLPISGEKWYRKAYTRREFQDLCRITVEMDKEEIRRRVRATWFPGAQDLPYVELGGYRFVLREVDLDK
ncbi:MAG: hypothetical protein KAT70_06940 [Thermoplasmata archaeon]|nr:hypothetical protein [Thermoplasmata archaeon]